MGRGLSRAAPRAHSWPVTFPGGSLPSDRALEFGERYAEVLAHWGELFAAASELVAANVRLGRHASDSAKEFDDWIRQTANTPWNWLSPDFLQRFTEAFRPPPPPGAS